MSEKHARISDFTFFLRDLLEGGFKGNTETTLAFDVIRNEDGTTFHQYYHDVKITAFDVSDIVLIVRLSEPYELKPLYDDIGEGEAAIEFKIDAPTNKGKNDASD